MSLTGSASQSKSRGSTTQTQTNTLSDRAAGAINDQMGRLNSMGYAKLDPGSAQQFMNPFQRDVIDATMAQSAQSDAVAQNEQRSRFAQAGAFGDSRRGVYEAELQGQQSRDRASQLAALNSANYGQALGVAQSENAQGNAYNIQIQQLLNQLTGMYGNEGTQTGSGTSKGSQTGFSLGASWKPTIPGIG